MGIVKYGSSEDQGQAMEVRTRREQMISTWTRARLTSAASVVKGRAGQELGREEGGVREEAAPGLQTRVWTWDTATGCTVTVGVGGSWARAVRRGTAGLSPADSTATVLRDCCYY